jgi:hypothetical protein
MEQDYKANLKRINWAQYTTAYGSADKIPKILLDLISKDERKAINASNCLESYLCHQHVQIHDAAIPALPFLFEALSQCSNAVAYEIVFTIWGFAKATQDDFWIKKPEWIIEIETGLQENIKLIQSFEQNSDVDIAEYAKLTLDILLKRDTKKI